MEEGGLKKCGFASISHYIQCELKQVWFIPQSRVSSVLKNSPDLRHNLFISLHRFWLTWWVEEPIFFFAQNYQHPQSLVPSSPCLVVLHLPFCYFSFLFNFNICTLFIQSNFALSVTESRIRPRTSSTYEWLQNLQCWFEQWLLF